MIQMKTKNSVLKISYTTQWKKAKTNSSSGVEINLYANTEHHEIWHIERPNLPENLKEGVAYHNGKIV